MGNKNRILVVEDNKETQLIIKAALRNNYELQIVPSAESALSALTQNKFSLVLLDLNLSGKGDGKTILKEIREVMKDKALPVIITTAYDLSQEDKKFFDENANAFLLKPLDKKTLLESIDNTIQTN